jgi:hypothetical protein
VTLRPWLAAAVFGTLLAAFSSGALPWVNALAGAFAPPDLAQDIAAGEIFVAGDNPYSADFAARHARVMGTAPQSGYPYFPHPPFVILLSVPFTFVGFVSAALLWFVISLGLVFFLARSLVQIWASGDLEGNAKPSARLVWTAFIGLLLWPPVLYNLEKGQFSVLLAVLVTWAYQSLRRGRSRLAGVLIGLAMAVKVFPALLGGYLLPRNRWTLVWSLAIASAITLPPLLWMGSGVIVDFVHHSEGNVQYWQTWPAVTYSIYGAAARLFIGGRWAVPLTPAPLLARILLGLISTMLLIVALAKTAHRMIDADEEGARFAVWTILLVLLNPLSMGHNGVLLALPIVLVARSLRCDLRLWPKFAWTVGTILVAIPRQTLLEISPPPVMSLQGLTVIALPMWGALLLLAASLAVSQAQSSPDHRNAAHAQTPSWHTLAHFSWTTRDHANRAPNRAAASRLR